MMLFKTPVGSLILSAGLLCLVADPLSARTLNVGVQGELASFDTSQVLGDDWEATILRDVYEGLLTENEKGEAIPAMATSWDISKDKKTYTFHIRDNAKWSDGVPVTADDFIFGWQHMLDPKSASEYAYMLYPLANAQAINTGKQGVDKLGVRSLEGGKVLEVTLNEPVPYFLEMLTHYSYYPQPKHLYDKYGKDWVKLNHIATNGAFKPTEWVSHSHVSTVKNKDYYDYQNLKIDGVTYYNAEDLNAATNRFRAGNLDITNYPTASYTWLKQNLPKATHRYPQLATYYYVFNTRPGHATADPRVREALTLATRRDVLSKSISKGADLPAEGFVPPGFKGYTPQGPDADGLNYQQRVAKAKALLQQAGYSVSKPLTLNLRYNTSENHRQIAVAIAAMWKPLGVNLNMINSEAAIHFSALTQGDFDIGRSGWGAEFNDPENFIVLMKSGVSKNYGAYSNPEYDQLIDEEHATQDTIKRYQLMEKAEKLAMNDYALLPLLTLTSKVLVNPDIKGWEDNALNHHPSRWVSFSQSSTQ